ncbi:MAG: hypothetical protein JW839_11050 [Candidatus Lokiarchaeota archaeon]|nr:hypothetical protein [Candidatus Lokiarchaeota archaeon]
MSLPASSTGSFGHPSTPPPPFRARRSSAPASTTDKAPIGAGLGSHQVPPRSFADDRGDYQEGFTVYFSRTLLCSPTGSFQGAETARVDTRAARKPRGAGFPGASLHFPPRAPRP